MNPETEESIRGSGFAMLPGPSKYSDDVSSFVLDMELGPACESFNLIVLVCGPGEPFGFIMVRSEFSFGILMECIGYSLRGFKTRYESLQIWAAVDEIGVVYKEGAGAEQIAAAVNTGVGMRNFYRRLGGIGTDSIKGSRANFDSLSKQSIFCFGAAVPLMATMRLATHERVAESMLGVANWRRELGRLRRKFPEERRQDALYCVLSVSLLFPKMMRIKDERARLRELLGYDYAERVMRKLARGPVSAAVDAARVDEFIDSATSPIAKKDRRHSMWPTRSSAPKCVDDVCGTIRNLSGEGFTAQVLFLSTGMLRLFPDSQTLKFGHNSGEFIIPTELFSEVMDRVFASIPKPRDQAEEHMRSIARSTIRKGFVHMLESSEVRAISICEQVKVRKIMKSLDSGGPSE